MKKLTINEELKNLLPPLSVEEYVGLEASMLVDGCLTNLIVWNGILIDGHHRYEICQRHSIPFSTKNIEFDSLDDAKLWVWQHQAGRRNLTAFQRAELALKFKDVIAAKAKKRQLQGCSRQGIVDGTLPGEAMTTREELGRIAGVSRDTIVKVEFLVQNADEPTKHKLRKGGKGISINREYSRLKYGDTQVATSADLEKLVKIKPKTLGMWIITRFSNETVRELILILLDHLRRNEAKS